MTKHELIHHLHKENKITKDQAESAVNTFFNEMTGALSKGERVEIRGLGSFHVRKYKAYIGKNPKTLEKVKVKSKKLPFFKCGRELKKRVDYK